MDLLGERQPAESAQGDGQAGQAPDRDDDEVGGGEAGSVGMRVVGAEERAGEAFDGEYVGDVGEPGREVRCGDETPAMKYWGNMIAWVTGWAES